MARRRTWISYSLADAAKRAEVNLNEQFTAAMAADAGLGNEHTLTATYTTPVGLPVAITVTINLAPEPAAE